MLDEESEQTFEWTEDGRVHQRASRGRRLVQVRVRKADDLASLTDEEARGLRGIEFEAWDAAIAQQLARIDVRQCLLAFPNVRSLDLDDLPPAARYLDFEYGPEVEPPEFARFGELRHLVVAPPYLWSDDQTLELAWVPMVPELRYLEVSGVVLDLRPLGGHPRLQTVVAQHSRITHLPDARVPSLRSFTASFSSVPADGIAHLRHQHPEASIQASVGEKLMEVLRPATRLLVRTGAVCHPKATDQWIYATEEPSELAAARMLLADLGSGYESPVGYGGCGMCALQFLDGDGAVLAEVEYVFGLRCREAFGSVASFASAESRQAFEQWLLARGLRILHPLPSRR